MIGQLEVPKKDNIYVAKLLVFGSWIVACGLHRVDVWKSSTYEHYITIMPTVAKSSTESALTGNICGMPTFLNKVFIGKTDGSVDIWNVSTGRLIHTIFSSIDSTGAVTAIEPSPALSIIAIARSDGSIALHNVLTDRPVLQLKSSQVSAVSSISFRTDWLGAGGSGDKDGMMATASLSSGDVIFWDLNGGGRISSILRGAHNPSSLSGVSGGVSRVEFLPGQDVMITSGSDNALKSWIFDNKTLLSNPRILHSRSGHAAPVGCLSFVPPNSEGSETTGKWLMSAGRDQSLWGWSLRRDGQSTELSQGNVQSKAKKLGLVGKALENESSMKLEDLKAPEITSIACSLNRDGGIGALAGGRSVWTNTSEKGSIDASEVNATGWESIVTAHRGDTYARTWFWGRKKAGRWAFQSDDGTEVSRACSLSCGLYSLSQGFKHQFKAFRSVFEHYVEPLPSVFVYNLTRMAKLTRHPVADHVCWDISMRYVRIGWLSWR